MRRFLELPVFSPLPDARAVVLRRALVYQPNGRAITVPEMFVTDLASVPRPLWWLIAPWGRHAPAAIVHDFLYWEQATTRERADRIFREAMEPLRVLFIVRWAMWAAVRVFGWIAWKTNAANKRRGQTRVLAALPTMLDPVPPRGLDRLVRVLFGRRAA